MADRIYRGREKKSLFARLAFCEDCGKGMNYKYDRKGYVCGTYQKTGVEKCTSHFINQIELKEAVLNDLRRMSSNVLDQNLLVQTILKRANVKVMDDKNDLNEVNFMEGLGF
ncbi:zinc ribbon domain-containing protein [Paenibacillus profundus]|uniref:Zinc ribbon domain-containing protein n=1 Tax=Paenibacillus profundus TaxID=1173085 RepID=A0ABS8YIS1_9BACL|nr:MULTISPECIES: zinc ribbon domain-containing protein [Paenibacillus]MCE5171808.1 zinc ribbon domain-containing protein [Paenibacillus profundus]